MIGCSQPVISCRILDEAAWSIICSLLLQPENLIRVIEGGFRGERNMQIVEQARY